jgi:hypothetical protein
MTRGIRQIQKQDGDIAAVPDFRPDPPAGVDRPGAVMIAAPPGVRVYLACGTTDIEERFLLSGAADGRSL